MHGREGFGLSMLYKMLIDSKWSVLISLFSMAGIEY